MSPNSPRRPHLKRHRRQPAQAGSFQLTERDQQVIEAVWEYRFLQRRHLQELVFHQASTAVVCHRLQLLYHHGYLDRHDRPILPQKGAPLYTLGPQGAELIAERSGETLAQLNRRRKKLWERSDLFLAHEMQVNECRIALTLATERRDDRELSVWAYSQEVQDRVSLRDSSGRSVERNFRPDAFCRLRVTQPSGKPGILACFWEIDRGTEPLQRIREKAQIYQAYRDSGAYDARYRQTLFRVLVPTTSNERLQNLKTAVKSTGAEMFWFGLLEDQTAEGFWQAEWWKVGEEEPRALLDS